MSFNTVSTHHYSSKPHESYSAYGDYTFRSSGSYGGFVGHSSILSRINNEISDALSGKKHHQHHEHNNIFQIDKYGHKIYASEVAREYDQRHQNKSQHHHTHHDEYQIGNLLSGKYRHNSHNHNSRLGHDYW